MSALPVPSLRLRLLRGIQPALEVTVPGSARSVSPTREIAAATYIVAAAVELASAGQIWSVRVSFSPSHGTVSISSRNASDSELALATLRNVLQTLNP